MTATLQPTAKCCGPENPASAKPSLLVFADDWGRHPSSCQHLVRRLQKDHRILWVNSIGTRAVKANSITLRRAFEKFRNWGEGLKQVAESMWVVDLPMLPSLGWRSVREINRSLVISRLRRILSKLRMVDPIVLTTLPYMEWLIGNLPRRSLIYYCTDDYSYWPAADRDVMQQADRDLSARADRILAASEALVEQHAYTGRCHHFPHGVDVEHFGSVQKQQNLHPELASLATPRIGFFGLIYEKLDFTLLTEVARRYAQGSLVMIGPIAYCPVEFSRLGNVHLLGQKNYQALPSYLAGLDVLLLPYVDDPMIRQSGPLKLRECLASGKPTVSVNVANVRPFVPHVRIGDTQEEYLEAIADSLQESNDQERILARQKAVELDGWDRRAEILREHIRKAQDSREAGTHRNGAGSPKRVLHLRTIAGKGGGPEKTLLNSPRFLKGRYQLKLAYVRPLSDPDYDMPERARKLGVDLLDIPEVGPVDPRTFWRLRQEIKAFRPHLLHAHDYKTDLLAVVLGKMFKIPVVTTMHGFVTRGGKLELFYRLDHWALQRMDHVIAVSPDLFQMLESLGVPSRNRSLIDNAIDADQFRRSLTLREAKNRLGIAPERLVIGAVGRLSAEKGFDVLLRAVHRLLQERFDVELLLVGQGEERSRLESLSQQLGNGNCVRLVGHQSDPRSYFEAMDVFALSSLREGLPNVLLEALAMEVPVVATRIAGVPRLVEDGVNGLLAAPGSVDELARGLARLLGDSDLRERFQRAGRRTVEGRYSFAERIKKIAAIYDRLLAQKRTNGKVMFA